jgi:hypothetical protein
VPESSDLNPARVAPNPWRVVLGISFIVVWVTVHVVLFYLLGAGGIVIEAMLGVAKSVVLPGLAMNPGSQTEVFTWVPAFEAALALAGFAGIPAGLAIFWQSRRKVLLWTFGISLFLGVAGILYAIFLLISATFAGIA